MSFWLQFAQPSCIPEGCQCEFVRDALIRQPSSFWTSAFFFLPVILLQFQGHQKSRPFYLWTSVLTVLALSSHLAHGSFTKLGVTFDFASIILVITFFALMNVLKKRFESLTPIILSLGVFFLSSVLVLYFLDKWVKIFLCLILVVFSLWDMKKNSRVSFWSSDLTKSLSILIISFIFFLLDEAHIGCDPMSLWQLHSLWHLGGALGIFYYSQWRFKALASA